MLVTGQPSAYNYRLFVVRATALGVRAGPRAAGNSTVRVFSDGTPQADRHDINAGAAAEAMDAGPDEVRA